MSNSNEVPTLLDLVEVAKHCHVSPHTVRAWVRKGRLRPVRICRRLLFHPREIARFLSQASNGDSDREIDTAMSEDGEPFDRAGSVSVTGR